MLGALNFVARFAPRPERTSTGLSNGVIERILVVELWNIGDVVLAMPFLAQLRTIFPRARITLLARPHARVVLEGTGLVDEFVETELGWTESATRFNPFGYYWSDLRRVRRDLKQRQFDVAFKCRMHIREHLVLAISGAKRRVAFAFENGDAVLTDAVPIGDPNRHKVEDWFELLKPFGGSRAVAVPHLKVSEHERRWASKFLNDSDVLSSDRIVGIHPGASVPEKRWPLERFAEVASSVAQRPAVKVIAFAEPGGYGGSLGRLERVIAAKVGLREMIALIERCEVLICNDSGPMHIAGALGIPTVAIFGTGINLWFAPLGFGHRIITSGSSDATESVGPYDLADIPVSRVQDELDAALRAHP